MNYFFNCWNIMDLPYTHWECLLKNKRHLTHSRSLLHLLVGVRWHSLLFPRDLCMFRLMIMFMNRFVLYDRDTLVGVENSPNIGNLATHLLINPLFWECPHPWAFLYLTHNLMSPFLGGMCFDSSFDLKRNICLAWKCYT
jgi:hypothetical protein